MTTGPRPILDGKEFNRFFPFTPDHTDPVVHRDGTVEDAVAVMAQVAERYKNDTALISPYLEGETTEITAQNIWNFIHTYIQYREDDKDIEQIRRPLRSWTDRRSGVDCDCMSVFASSILKNLGIPHSFRITKYGGDEFQHVYVIIPRGGKISGMTGYYTIDGVIDAFDKEKKFTENKDFNISGMKIQTLNGPGDKSLYDYLVESRDIINANPEALEGKICPCDAVPMLDMVIESWSNPAKRNAVIANNAKVEQQNFPNLKFFQQLSAYMQGVATPESVMSASYFGFKGLGGDTGVGDNGDGTYYIFDQTTGETLQDNIPYESGSGSGGSDSGTSWWSSGGGNTVIGAGAGVINSILSIFGGNKNNTTVTPPPKTTRTTPPITPMVPATQSGMGAGAILLTVGVVAGIGVLIWSMGGKDEKKQDKKAA